MSGAVRTTLWFLVLALLTASLPAAGQDVPDRIAFARKGPLATAGLWTISPDGSEPLHVSGRGRSWIRNDYAPTWSWDRSRLAFHSGSRISAIWSVAADGTDERQITFPEGRFGDEQPTWSPDGTAVAFTFHFERFADIFRQAVDGSGRQRMTSRTRGGFNPTWSPDGSLIAFRGNIGGSTEIFIVDATGEEVTRLTGTGGQKQDLVWSPDSSRLAFAACPPECNNAYNIHLLDIASRRTTTIRLPGREVHPVWSPEGTRLAFVRKDVDRNVYIVNADGTGIFRLTPAPGADYSPAWSPDGTRIAFISKRDGNPELYVMNADGSEQTRLTVSEDIEAEPAWGPGGASSN